MHGCMLAYADITRIIYLLPCFPLVRYNLSQWQVIDAVSTSRTTKVKMENDIVTTSYTTTAKTPIIIKGKKKFKEITITRV